MHYCMKMCPGLVVDLSLFMGRHSTSLITWGGLPSLSASCSFTHTACHAFAFYVMLIQLGHLSDLMSSGFKVRFLFCLIYLISALDITICFFLLFFIQLLRFTHSAQAAFVLSSHLTDPSSIKRRYRKKQGNQEYGNLSTKKRNPRQSLYAQSNVTLGPTQAEKNSKKVEC
jgi:hypothetical protein